MNIPVFLSSNNNYAPFVSTVMYSILKNTKSFIEFYILENGISEINKEKIKKSNEKYKNFSIEFLDMSEFELDRFPNLKHYTTSCFSRYFIAELKPDLKKAIYFDCDIIVKSDIKKLFEQDISPYPIGAVLEDFYPVNSEYLKTIYPMYSSDYFNSGVLLLDLEQFRKNNYTQKLLDTTFKHISELNTADQDVLNIVFENNFKTLDYKFNFMPDFFESLKIAHPQLADKVKKNAVVLHYTRGKPWLTYSTAASDFWKIAKCTLFYGKLDYASYEKQYGRWRKWKLLLKIFG